MNRKIELVCPAGSLPALRAAVDNGADAVYMGFRDGTNARNFPGLNFDERAARDGIRYARERGRKVLLALNTYPQPQGWQVWTAAVDKAAELGVDALILADVGLMRYAATTHPELRLHLSVQGSATSYEAINFYREQFNVQRVVLPRVLSLSQVERVKENTDAEIEVFAFGSLCVMVEGRCYLSSYATGESPNTCGACSPAKAVEWRERFDRDISSRWSCLARSGVSARQMSPRPCLAMKLMASGVAICAGMTRSPSFSRSSASTRLGLVVGKPSAALLRPVTWKRYPDPKAASGGTSPMVASYGLY